MVWTKGTHQNAKFQTFDCSREISPHLYFDGLLLLRVYRISAKKVYRGLISHDYHKNWWILTWDLSNQSSQNIHFNWFLLCKVFSIWPKKSTEVLSFMTMKIDAKSEEKLTCGLENDLRNTANFHQSTWKITKLGLDKILLSKVENIWD